MFAKIIWIYGQNGPKTTSTLLIHSIQTFICINITVCAAPFAYGICQATVYTYTYTYIIQYSAVFFSNMQLILSGE